MVQKWKAEYKGSPLIRKPKQISSLNEFHEYFGFCAHPLFKMKVESNQNVTESWGTAASIFRATYVTDTDVAGV